MMILHPRRFAGVLLDPLCVDHAHFEERLFDKTVARRRYQSTDREYDKRAHFKRRQEVEPQLHGSHEYDGVPDVERIAVFPHAGEESREWQGVWFLLLKIGAALAAALCGYM
jgi:hypothetical protein